jgi:hypothetical protein
MKVIESLKRNRLSSDSDLFVFSDGGRNPDEHRQVNLVRDYVSSVSGFRSLKLFFSDANAGLASSIIRGVSAVMEERGKVIVIEDDLITSPNFLDFVNQALETYQHDPRVFSVSGYSLNLPSLKKSVLDVYFGHRASSWGWGTWRNRWDSVDWNVSGYDHFKKNRELRKAFQRGGADMPRMLSKQMAGKIDSWAIRFCYSQFQQRALTVFPTVSKVRSIGFGRAATHTKRTTRFDTLLDSGDKTIFGFPEEPFVDERLAREFRWKFSSFRRAMDRLGL